MASSPSLASRLRRQLALAHPTGFLFMTGFCGWFDPRGVERSSDSLARMASQLRGPSPRPIIEDGGAAIAATTDVAQATSEDRRKIAIIHGRPRWPDATLNDVARDRGDAHALLALDDRDRAPFTRLTGTYAAAVLDLDKRTVTLAVDRMGVQPMCYGMTAEGCMVFGSTATSVAAHMDVPATISSQSVYRYFYFHVIPSPATIFRDVLKLEPAQVVDLTPTSTNKHFHWQPESTIKLSGGDEADVLSALQEETRQAIARYASDDKTACFLSGGIDSSTVSGVASEVAPGRMRAYTVGFDQQGFDETSFARISARHFDLDHVEHYITQADVAAEFDVLSTAYDEPFGNSSAIPTYFCAKKASSDGIRCLLAGDGGDELFAGNERYATQQLFQRYHQIPGAIRRLFLESTVGRLRVNKPTLVRKAWRYIEQARIDMPDRLQTYNFLHMFAPQGVFEPDYLATIDLDGPIAEMREWYARSEGCDFLDRMLLFDWKLTLADNDLRKVNRMCEAGGLEVEYPLLDDELVAHSLTIAPTLKLRSGNLRYAFKKAHEGYLPNDVLTKEKHGFGLPFGDWLKQSGELRDVIMPKVDAFRSRGILQDTFVDDMLRRHQQEHAAFYGNMIWLIAVLENWLTANADDIAP